jgi:spermidine/putrescine-binding protein
MINKKLSLAVLAVATLGLSACGSPAASTSVPTGPELTLWCTALDGDFTNQMISDFKAANPDYADYNIHVLANIAENEAQGKLHKDTTAAADVICMVDDNIRAAVAAKDLLALDDATKTAIVASDGQEAVDAGSIGGTLYGYPYRADNAPLLIYNSKLISASDITSFEKLFAAAKTAKTKVALDIGNGWYNPFMFWAGGGDFKIDGEENIAANFANVDGCVTSAQAVYDLYTKYQDNWNITSDEGVIQAGFADGTLGAAFLWNNLAAIRAAMEGSAVGAATDIKVAGWPTLSVGGVDVANTFFKGYKHYVIKSAISTDLIPAAKAFCAFATSEAEQDKRAADTTLAYGPSNLKSKAKDVAKNLEWGSVIMAADALNHTRSQALTTNSSFWDPMGAFGGLIKAQTNWGEFGTCKRAIQNIVSTTGWTSVTKI